MWLLQSLFIYLFPSFLILVNRGFWRIIICISDARGIKRHSAVNERPEGGKQEPSHPREGDPGRSQSPLWRLPRALRPGEAEPVKCVREARGGQGRGTGRAVRTSGAPGLWELGKTQPPLCSPRGCQGSGESQLSSLISTVEGRKHRRAISPGSPATEEAWREAGKVRWRRKEVVFVGPLRHWRGDRREQRKEEWKASLGDLRKGRETTTTQSILGSCTSKGMRAAVEQGLWWKLLVSYEFKENKRLIAADIYTESSHLAKYW